MEKKIKTWEETVIETERAKFWGLAKALEIQAQEAFEEGVRSRDAEIDGLVEAHLRAIKASIQEGRKEVVDWIKDNGYIIPKYKLKEWGIE